MTVDDLNFDKGGGVITAVAQDATTGAVLMVAQMDREAFDRTVATGEMHYRSRTRGLWHKGETSGNVQHVVEMLPDCDGDAVLARVHPAGPACHTGAATCFGGGFVAGDALSTLAATIEARMADDTVTDSSLAQERPSYTKRLLRDRNLRLKKLGEEMAELVTAIADGDAARAAEEGADVLYHALVALRSVGITVDDVRRVLTRRTGAGT